MISAAAFADAAKHVSPGSTPYAPTGVSARAGRRRRRRFRDLTAARVAESHR